GRTDAPDVVEQSTPAAAEIENAPSRLDPDLLRNVVVLAPLSLLEGQREVTVVLGSAEVRELTQAEPDDPIGQRIAEIDVLAVSHECQPRTLFREGAERGEMLLARNRARLSLWILIKKGFCEFAPGIRPQQRIFTMIPSVFHGLGVISNPRLAHSSVAA